MKSKYIVIFLAVFGLSLNLSCSKPDTKAADEIVKKAEEDAKKRQEELDNILKSSLLVAGGQPGKISVSGIVVKEAVEGILLDERFSVSQSPGKSNSDAVSVQISKDNKAVLSLELDPKGLEKLSADKTFVNLNCEQLDPALINGLTEGPGKPLSEGILMVSANTIVICENIELLPFVNSFSADHLILNNVDTVLIGSVGGLISLNANKLTLIGKNKFVAKGLDGSGIVISGPSIELKVIKEIHGEGTLHLSSIGGNNLKSEPKK